MTRAARALVLSVACGLAPVVSLPAQGGSGRGAAPPPASKPATIPQKLAAILGGSSLALEPGGAPVGTLESPIRAEVVERRNGWTRVRLDLWVRDAALGDSLLPGEISGADVRAQPERYVGRTVDWSLQSLGVATADELRPEMPMGQPYLLARGPLPETGFVYLMLPKEQVEAFRGLPPLTKLRVRATIVAGKSRFLDTPVLNLVRRLGDTTEAQ